MLATVLISLALAGTVALIVWSMLRDKKRGKSTCGSNCAHCSMAGSCHTDHKA